MWGRLRNAWSYGHWPIREPRPVRSLVTTCPARRSALVPVSGTHQGSWSSQVAVLRSGNGACPVRRPSGRAAAARGGPSELTELTELTDRLTDRLTGVGGGPVSAVGEGFDSCQPSRHARHTYIHTQTYKHATAGLTYGQAATHAGQHTHIGTPTDARGAGDTPKRTLRG